MIEVIYHEEGILDHPSARTILARYPRATLIPCTHYKDVFNPGGQSFRLQKQKPSLILARQSGSLVHPVPATYGIGGTRNFYFSHLLNCLYDCRYCFLQGMFPSAHYVLFVNYDDFQNEILRKTEESKAEQSWFFSGYDCDSLALENVTGFADSFLPFFAKHTNAHFELRTKSVNLKVLEKTTPLPNVVTAFSFTPDEISDQLEHGVPSVSSRIRAMEKIAELGWPVGLRIDPLIDCVNFEERYRTLFDKLFANLPPDSVHSVSLGAFRVPVSYFKKMEKLYPEEPLFAGKLEKRGNFTGYRQEIEQDRSVFCRDELLKRIPKEKLFQCETSLEESGQ
jgi:spore photoproduct lyase